MYLYTCMQVRCNNVSIYTYACAHMKRYTFLMGTLFLASIMSEAAPLQDLLLEECRPMQASSPWRWQSSVGSPNNPQILTTSATSDLQCPSGLACTHPLETQPGHQLLQGSTRAACRKGTIHQPRAPGRQVGAREGNEGCSG